MSRTIRRKGWHVVKSSKWNGQNNNEFAYIKSYNEYVKTQKDKENQQKYVELRISENRERPLEAKKLIAKSKRDGFWKTLRWTRYAMPVPRLFHKAEIKRALKYDEEYNWDEAGARTIEQGICEWLWD